MNTISMSATAKYPSAILEEELKNKVAADWFGTFDCSRILGKVDFCAAVPATDLPLCDAESVLWAEAKRGADAPLDFAQFFMRIHDEIPGCVLAEFSKLKHLQSPNFKAFRQAFHGTLEKCFIVPADTFDNVKGDFPIGFFVWRLGNDVQRRDAEAQIGFANARDARSYHVDEPVGSRVPRDLSPCLCASVLKTDAVFTSAVADVYNRKGEFIGTKTILSYDSERSINDWLIETRKRTSHVKLGFLSARSHDIQHVQDIYIKADKALIKSARGSWITDANLTESVVYVAACHCIEANWLNDRDQFLYPNDGWRDDFGFHVDCLVYTLFSDFNVIKSKDGINHWIPFTEEEVGAKDCFTSHFMSDWLAGRTTAVAGRPPYQGDLFADARDARPYLEAESAGSRVPRDSSPLQDSNTPNNESDESSASLRLCVKDKLSPAARAVLDAGRELWCYYHAQPNANPNASFYDIRLHFQGSTADAKGKLRMNSESSDTKYTALIGDLRKAMKALVRHIKPKVYEYGFLRR